MATPAGFWDDSKTKHQKIAKTVYENIEYAHPDTITSGRYLPSCLHEDSWQASCVKYYTYTGPNITGL